ncbi:GNAT family N-acetyltransferase [Paracoccus zhejiangensis]|uniref:GNAT family N-acetyltransferase n=1 Tax=Paracoccus zhejiangensis TaxID=1077935 RepID=A0A2H5EZ58_9RHOB|nr:GNAT family N-acetyltransferase [Paracoccus zhejiangensis]AUH64585.1 GNAT family N-acetyltransferase [Paracoccus zhejiangensis]
MDAGLSEAFEATWPAEDYADAGGFRIGRAPGAGGRVNSARAAGVWSDADVDAAIAVMRGWGQPLVFRVLDGDERLQDALTARGFRRENPTAIMAAPIARLTDRELPPVTAFAIWPPMAIQRDIWAAGNIKAARQQVMLRVPEPRTSILGRIKDRAAGAGFAAIHGDVAMVHALEVLPDWRRLGLAGWMMRQAAFWAAEHGAARIGLAVSRANAGAVALYRAMGFDEIAGYAYYEA